MSMNPAIPDIAVCGAGSEMMSLAGAAPVDTEISVATRVGTTGRYTFSLKGNTTTEVWLKDYQTGIVTNLMEEDYTAEITATASPGLNTGRFSVTIGSMRPELGGHGGNDTKWNVTVKGSHVTVTGLAEDSEVLFFTTDGILRHRDISCQGKCEADLAPGVVVVRAEGSSRVVVLNAR